LYCAKGNYEFGISRIVKSLEPYNKKVIFRTVFGGSNHFLALSPPPIIIFNIYRLTLIPGSMLKDVFAL